MIERFRIKWILMNRVPIPCDSLIRWGVWMQDDGNRVVGDTKIDEELRVSTVFMGLDHNYSASLSFIASRSLSDATAPGRKRKKGTHGYAKTCASSSQQREGRA